MKCGLNNDIEKAFINAGYEVVAVDGSTALSEAAFELIGQSVICTTFQEYEPQVYFDGIWACASLLHLEKNDIHDVIEKLGKKLNAGGCFYMSFKYGNHVGERNGRFFTDMTEERFAELIEDLTDLTIEKNIFRLMPDRVELMKNGLMFFREKNNVSFECLIYGCALR